jgi:hypothetical protein
MDSLIPVAAQSSTENIQEVALAIDPTTTKDMARLRITNANELNKISPALNLPLSII